MRGRKSDKSKGKIPKKLLGVRISEDNPIFKETDKARVVEEALRLYYAVKVLCAQVKPGDVLDVEVLLKNNSEIKKKEEIKLPIKVKDKQSLRKLLKNI